ncbi:MAG TPA: alkaline phosphatase PhoX [Actinomycetota bacterium]|nr:alkaline phosphatase PhoX [Actinomycetota bacterium]
MDRRTFLRNGLFATAAFTSLGASFWQRAVASHPAILPGQTPYGPLSAPDANGIRLPQGFTSREIARSGRAVPGTNFVWHSAPDGGATFGTDDRGWIYVSNSEIDRGGGGVGALRFDSSGEVVDAYRVLYGTSRNCAGGSTPWGTWITCEETQTGLAWECDPTGAMPAIPRPALGTFSHEAAVVDPQSLIVYLTEDQTDGRFYRFVPSDPLVIDQNLLETGRLEVARVAEDGSVTWLAVPEPNPLPVIGTPTRQQVPMSTKFNGGEGMWFDEAARTVYFTTKGDNTVWAYHVDARTIEVLFSSALTPGSPMNGVDNIVMSPGREIFVCEDHSSSTPLEMIIISPEAGVVGPFAEFVPPLHGSTELAGAAFDPSGTRMYVSSQRAYVAGVTYEITGPFRGAA